MADQPPAGLSERQLIKWFGDQPKRDAERARKEEEAWKKAEAIKAKIARGKKKKEDAKRDQKLFKQQQKERKKQAKLRQKEEEFKAKAERKKKRKGGAAGFAAMEYTLSADLATVCGAPKLSRPQVVAKIWEYIRANNLQNPKDKREILCDAPLKRVMDDRGKVTMFEMNKYIGAHMSGLAKPTSNTQRSKSSKAKASANKSSSDEEDSSSNSDEEASSSSDEEDDGEDGPSLTKLRKAAVSYLQSADLEKLTNKTLRKYLEKLFEVDLHHRKEFLKGVVQTFLEDQANGSKGSKKRKKSGSKGSEKGKNPPKRKKRDDGEKKRS
jgi:hypothetical protein